MNIDVLKAMGLTQPQAVERSARTADGTPFAKLLDRANPLDQTGHPTPPARPSRREAAAESRPLSSPPEAPEVVTREDAQATNRAPEAEAGREAETQVSEEEATAEVDVATNAPRHTASRPNAVRKAITLAGSAQDATTADASLAEAAEAGNTAALAQPALASNTPLAQVALAIPTGSQPGDTAPLQSPAGAGTATPPETPLVPVAAAPAPALAMVEATVAAAAAPTLGPAGPAGTSQALDGMPALTQAAPTTAPQAGAGSTVGADGAQSGTGPQAQFSMADAAMDSVSVRVAGPAVVQPVAVPAAVAGSALVAPGSVLAALSADRATLAKPGEAALSNPSASDPTPSDAAPPSGDDGGGTPAAPSFKPTAQVAGQGMAPMAPAGGQTSANGKAAALEAAGAPVSTGTAPGGQATPAGLADSTLASSNQPMTSATGSSPGTSPATPAHPRWATPMQTPASQVGARLAAQAGDGSRSYDIQLDPANLGRVRVHLDVGKDGAVTASISADRADTLMMLRSDARTLQQALQDAGLSTTAGSLDFSLSGQRRDGGPWGGGAGNLQAMLDDGAGDLRQPDITPSAISPSGRPGRGSRAVDLKV